jgi:hypothetical protein
MRMLGAPSRKGWPEASCIVFFKRHFRIEPSDAAHLTNCLENRTRLGLPVMQERGSDPAAYVRRSKDRRGAP